MKLVVFFLVSQLSGLIGHGISPRGGLLTVIQGLKLLSLKGWKEVDVEGDCQTVISWVKNREEIPWTMRPMERMREVQLSAHTVKSHGVSVTKFHMHDWLMLLFLVVIKIILTVIHPFYRFVGKDMMNGLKYPLKDSTVPMWTVPIFTVLLPIVIFIAFYFCRRDIYDLHNSILVGRPRPDFFWRCFPDGKDVYDQLGNVICHGKANVIKDGHKSFPSGHTSWSFSGLGFLSLYLSGKIKAFDHRGHVAKLCIIFLPLLVASLVGISRVDDYKHHWQDVFAGGLLGFTVATLCYLQFFPPPYHTNGCRSYAYLRMLEAANASEQPTNAVSTLNVDAMRVQQQVEQNNNQLRRLSDTNGSNNTLDELESGMRAQAELMPLLLKVSRR
ncbi:PREDICTED: putative lipid phosphate phosphatase 3, chloroplastic isoform X2 [Nelumbo nucifera]|uniref:Lipid phosphate phosphatase 3, chloroplastic isoform X2 n=1 Tax=Nelumbo nucifera TaxID=4432 RepID=A0A1U8BC24_NELNU|nr:PREDICTED: putative lipid phosphate phosphatase 3, chloroplastic isoform X2 [Nelumbo nucifera]